MQVRNAMPSNNDLEIIVKSSSVLGRTKTRLSNVNEDYKYVDSRNGLFMIADGMGGHKGGHQASRIAVQTVADRFSRFLFGLREGVYGEKDIAKKIQDAIHYTNDQVIYPISAGSEELNGFGTTLDLVYLFHDSVYIAHVGDSGVYIHRGGQLNRITSSKKESGDSFVEHYLGKKKVEIDMQSVGLKQDDVILMATDGLINNVSSDEIEDIISSNMVENIPGKLVYRAKYPRKEVVRGYADLKGVSMKEAREGLADNITVVTIEVQGYKNG